MYDVQVIDRFQIIKSQRLDPHTEGYAWVKPGSYLEDWDLLTDQVLLKEYPLEDGSGYMGIKLVVCDSGGKDGVTANAYNYWRKLRTLGLHHRLLLLKGDSAPGAPRVRIEHPDTKRKDGSANARGEIPVMLINPNMLKDDLNGRLDRTVEGGGQISWPDWLGDDWYVELTGERRTPKGWEKLGSRRRNEAWDLLVYCIATCIHLSVDRFDWANPPGWAKPWVETTLVRKADQPARFTPKKPGTYDAFAKLGESLG
jgi:phage terminase large subunit GpA-like protein